MARAKTVWLLQLEAKRNLAMDRISRDEPKLSALKARLAKLALQVDEAERALRNRQNDVAGYNGIISLMVKAGAVRYVSEDGMIQEWVMPDGSRKDATQRQVD